MKKGDEQRAEYDFSGAERGRYAKRLEHGYTIVVHRQPAADSDSGRPLEANSSRPKRRKKPS